MQYKSSNAELEEFLGRCDPADVHALIGLMRSRLSRKSKRLAGTFGKVEEIPPSGTEERKELCTTIVNLIGWYGSNLVAYGVRRKTKGNGAKQYMGITRDVLRLLNKRLPRKERQKIPRATGIAELEQQVVEILLAMRFHKKKTDEIVQILEESGLEKDVALDIAVRHGPGGLASAGLPILTKILGKKTVMTMVQQTLVAVIGRFISEEAAKTMAKRLAVKITQKALTRLINVIGWVLLALDVVFFATSPARRMTIRIVPYVSLVRVRERLGEDPADNVGVFDR
jgi:hypothetical protein